MSVTHVSMGDKGRLVVPRDVRLRQGWTRGSALVLTELENGEVRIWSAEAALTAFRASVAGTFSPVDELIAERRREAAADS